MSLIDTIGRLFQRRAVTPAPDTSQTTKSEIDQFAVVDFGQKLRAEQERSRIITVCNAMYDEDPRAEAAINALARDMAKDGFQIRSQNQAAVDVAQALIERLKLQQILDDYVRETLIDGDNFVECGISADLEIASLSSKPPLLTHRNTDRTDQFIDPARAYWYADQFRWSANLEPPREALWFAEWQIIHMRWNKRNRSRYGRPLFASATSAYKRVKEGEFDISVRRKTRAGQKFLHIVEGADAAGLEAYKEQNKAALTNPFAAIQDFFSNKPGSLQSIQGDARLNDIADVVHHIETWWTAAIIPMVLVGYGKDLNRDVLEQKLTQYERSLEQLTVWLETELVRPLLEREWLLHGIYPDTLAYELVWRNKAPSTPTDLKNVADAIVRFKALAMPDDVIWSIVARFLPWLDLTALLENSAAEGSASGDAPSDNAADTGADRIAADLQVGD